MSEQKAPYEKPALTVVAQRPVNLVRNLHSSEGVLVAVRLPSGEDAHVPLHVLFSLFAGEIAAKVRIESGIREA